MFQSVFKEWLGPASWRRSWMTTAIQASSAEQVDDGGGVAWRIFTNSSFAINVDKQTNKQTKLTIRTHPILDI